VQGLVVVGSVALLLILAGVVSYNRFVSQPGHEL
jgi:hypothetical protein